VALPDPGHESAIVNLSCTKDVRALVVWMIGVVLGHLALDNLQQVVDTTPHSEQMQKN